jgi:hypothetical protein
VSVWRCLAAFSRFTLLAVASAGSAELTIEPLTFEAGGDAAQPNVAALPGSGFIVTWQQHAAIVQELWFAELNSDGKELRRGRIARGADWFINWADFPSLAVLDNGDWVAYWLQKNAAAPEAYDIQLTRSTDRGRHWSRPVAPHTDGTPTQHGFVSLLPDGDDRVLVVWLDGRRAAGQQQHDEEAAPMTLRAAVLDRYARRSGEALLDDSTCSCCQTDAVRWAGRVLVAYRDRSSDEIRDIAVSARGIDGQWSKPRILSDDNWKIEGCPVNGPALAANGEKILALWPTLVNGQMVQRYTIRQWDQRGPETRTMETGERVRGRVDAAPWGEGFLISWLGGQQQDAGPRLGVIDANGKLAEKRIVDTTSGSKAVGFVRMASLGTDSDAKTAWRALLAWAAPDGGERMTVHLRLVKASAIP